MGFQVLDSTGRIKVVTASVTNLTSSVTGAQNNFAPGIGADTLISWSGASDATFTGFASGAAGKKITFLNTGTKVAYFSHQSGSSSAGNKLRNTTTSVVTPVSTRGYAIWEHDGTDWRLIAHEQGAWIDVAFSATDYAADVSTWTVALADLVFNQYRIDGRTLTWTVGVAATSSVGAGNVALTVLLPNGMTTSAIASAHPVKPAYAYNAGTLLQDALVAISNATHIVAHRGGAGFTAGSMALYYTIIMVID
jgi:hypothetical protein